MLAYFPLDESTGSLIQEWVNYNDVILDHSLSPTANWEKPPTDLQICEGMSNFGYAGYCQPNQKFARFDTPFIAETKRIMTNLTLSMWVLFQDLGTDGLKISLDDRFYTHIDTDA